MHHPPSGYGPPQGGVAMQRPPGAMPNTRPMGPPGPMRPPGAMGPPGGNMMGPPGGNMGLSSQFSMGGPPNGSMGPPVTQMQGMNLGPMKPPGGMPGMPPAQNGPPGPPGSLAHPTNGVQSNGQPGRISPNPPKPMNGLSAPVGGPLRPPGVGAPLRPPGPPSALGPPGAGSFNPPGPQNGPLRPPMSQAGPPQPGFGAPQQPQSMNNQGPPQMGGGPPQMGNGPTQMGGGPSQMGGGPPSMNNQGPPQMGGGPPQMGGGPPQMGGGPPQMGGGPPQMGDGPPQMGGPLRPPSGMGGLMPPSSMGGLMPPSSMGGQMPPNSMGGQMPPNSMGGQMPGPPGPPMMGVGPPMMGGGQMPGPPMMGGPMPPMPSGPAHPQRPPMGPPGQMPGMPPQMNDMSQPPHAPIQGGMGFTGGPPVNQRKSLDPDSMPNPIQVMQDDMRAFSSGEFYTDARGKVPPLVTTKFITRDMGHAAPNFIRSTMYTIPDTPDMKKQTGVPFGLLVSPFSQTQDGEYPPPVVNLGELGPVRCIRCRAYMCPFMVFTDGGKRFSCSFCKATTEVPQEYFQHLDHTGQRIDKNERPELCLGTFEFLATKDYCRNSITPKPPGILFAIDVSYPMMKEGIVQLISQNIKDILKDLPVDTAAGQTKSLMKVGFMTYDKSIHFYNLSPLDFSGNLTRGITGFYLSRYTNEAGEKVPIATSKFQPTYARKAFPCFDEPSFKSTFTTKLVKPTERYIALSNMPEESQATNLPSNGLTTVTFQKSVPMVTYLACFIVCDFEYQEKLTAVHQTKFRVYATPQQKETVRYALDIGANITDFFTNYFDLPYPLPKQDMIAIPDFVSGAMEHWGLITYRETNLLYDAKESSTYNQQRVASVVSHELAHQWFGNLVTLEWWDDLWLNEGFASYMEYKGVANYHDDWEIEDQFISSDLHSVMKLDATVNSHPIVQDVSHPDQITEIFDAISYNKGASVLRMLENFMGAEEFRKGIHEFLKRYQYGNAVTADLWRELEAVSSTKLAITKIMDTWTRQMGYPILNVEKISNTRYKLTQSRYLADQTTKVDNSESPFEYRWDVPVTWVTDTSSEPTLRWLSKDEAMLEINLPEGTNWVKFNVGQFGYYRVNYPTSEWEKLAEVLETNPSALQSTDRASLLNDAFSLAQSGHISYAVPLSMTKYMAKEKNLVPWETVFDTLVEIKDLLTYTETYPLFQEYIQDLVRAHYSRLGWDDTGSHAEKLSRYNIISLACRSGLQECLDQAASLFTTWITDPETYISPNLRTTVYKYGMQGTGDWKTWSAMFTRYLNEENPQEKKKLMYGLSQTKEPWILKRFLELAKNESNVRSQDYFSVIQLINLNPVGAPLSWDYLREEWDYLVDRFTLNDRYLGRTVKYLVEGFTTEFQLSQVEAFFQENPEAGAGARSRLQALEKIKLNIKWLSDHKMVVQDWLLNRSK